MTFESNELEYEIDENGCWICTSHTQNDKGYVYLRHNGKRYSGHRYSYIKHKGKIKKGLVVRHTCDVRNCINPDHLILGTVQQNVNDRVKRNRGACGSKVHTSKLSDKQIEFIRKDKSMTNRELADLFGVHNSTVSRARKKSTWKHV